MADAFLELEQQGAARDLTHAEWLAHQPRVGAVNRRPYTFAEVGTSAVRTANKARIYVRLLGLSDQRRNILMRHQVTEASAW